jgi:hypothetical protein
MRSERALVPGTGISTRITKYSQTSLGVAKLLLAHLSGDVVAELLLNLFLGFGIEVG